MALMDLLRHRVDLPIQILEFLLPGKKDQRNGLVHQKGTCDHA